MTIISTPDALAGYVVTNIDFEQLAIFDGEEFGFKVGQPYANIGLNFTPALVDSNANLNSTSSCVGVKSATIYTQGNKNFLRWQFFFPQIAVGFFYRDLLASSINVRAYDKNGNIIEDESLTSGEGYTGFIRSEADIITIEISAPHNTVEEAISSRTYIDDLSFSGYLVEFTTLKNVPNY